MVRLVFWMLLWPVCAVSDVAGPIHVVDGDTLRVGGETVRLQGIDAPEMGQSCRGPAQTVFDCGKMVRDRARARFEGRTGRCQAIERDRYERIVAICRVGNEDVGQWLVQEGLAFAYRRYSMAYDLDEKAAAVALRGLHAFAVQGPSAFRAAKRDRAPQKPPESNCVIKGNLSGRGKIYHVPGQAFYAKTRINENRGERWFCSEAEARKAGWRRAGR